MPRRRNTAVALSESITVTEPVPMEDLDDDTVEDYKRLNDKLDTVMTKIKGRKESKRKK